jgi:hypothetical protein
MPRKLTRRHTVCITNPRLRAALRGLKKLEAMERRNTLRPPH